MEFDRAALNRLLALSDVQLKYIVNKFISEYGIDLSGFDVTVGDISSVRRALEGISDEELSELSRQISRGGRR